MARELLGEGDGETNEASGSSRADGSEVELVVEQDQSLHDSCGGIVWESAYALEQYMRLNIGRICASPPVKRVVYRGSALTNLWFNFKILLLGVKI